jgi:hypothetical protein
MACRASIGVLALGCWSCGADKPGEGGEGGARDGGAGDRSVDSREANEAGPRDTGPSEADIEDASPHAVVAVPLTGCSAATYLAEVEIGAEVFDLQLDTASTTLAVASAGCKSCGVTPVFTPDSGAVDEHQVATSEYGIGSADAGLGGFSGWTGEVYDDGVSVGGTAAASVRMRFAAIEAQSQFFYPYFTCGSAPLSYQGIVGFALAKDELAGTDGYLDRLVAAASFSNVFATELCDPGGTLWLGGYDPAYVTAPPQYTPYFTSVDPSKYGIYLKQVVVEGTGTTVDVPTAASPLVNTYLDTGDDNFYLPAVAFSTVANAITGSAGFKAAFGADAGGPDAGVFDPPYTCLTTTLTKDQLDSTLPPITLVFGSTSSASITAAATEAYFVPSPTGGVTYWCPGMFPLVVPESVGPYFYTAILGTPILRSSVVIYDREHDRIGFAPHTPCP